MSYRPTFRWGPLALLAVLVLATALPVSAQGTQSGQIRGAVTLDDGSPVQGVLVTATSPALQGDRTTYTTETGEFILRVLPPGAYTVSFELEGMTPLKSNVTVQLGQVTPLNVTMKPKTIEETIVVTGEQSSVLADSQVSTTYTSKQVNDLPIFRTPAAIAAIAPGLTTNTPNAGQVTISGGFAYDNVFLVDGVDVNDNLFGTTNNVYIEDAIADVQVLTSGISAEYGRFSGGVINVITKSGGNEFSGSLRTNLTNDSWRSRTPLEKDNGTKLQDKTNHFDEATVGGYILKDKLWFFAAGRNVKNNTQRPLRYTGVTFNTSNKETRVEGKLTWNIANQHQIQAQYTKDDNSASRTAFSFSATPSTRENPSFPAKLYVARYNGALTQSLFGELQASQKKFGFRGSGGTSTDIHDSPLLSFGDITPFVAYNAPYFDATDPEDRNNKQYYGALSWFLDTQSTGSHDLKFGYEDYKSTRTGGNSQSSTNYVFYVNPLTDANGDPVFNGNELIPNFETYPSNDAALILNWLAQRGAELNIKTQSLYANDRWRLNDHWSFNLGVRYESVKGDATGGITTVDTSRLVPRLGASYDVQGNGKYRVDATYAEYSGKYSEAQFGANSTVGNPRLAFGVYLGPPGQGVDFDPGFNPDNYFFFYAYDPTGNVIVENNIKSPVVKEWTLSAGMQLRRGGYLKAIYTNRDYSSFVENFLCTASAGVPCPGPGDTGTSLVSVGPAMTEFNNIVYANSNEPTRKYQGLQLIGRSVLSDNWEVDGSWTHQFKDNGNFEGEGVNTPGISSLFGYFPGYYVPSRHYPDGKLNDYQADKIRAWTTYTFNWGRGGDLAATLLANYNSATTFSYTASLPAGYSATQRAILSHYLSSPNNFQTVYFGDRGAGTFKGATTFDVTLLYDVPVWQRLDAFVKADVINILNDDTLITWDTSITPVAGGPVDSTGLPTTYTKTPNFGNPIDNTSYPLPRQYRLAVGFRF